MTRKKRWMMAAVLAVIVLLAMIALDARLMVRRYSVEADPIASPIRIALVTDLHSCRYGENQRELTSAIAEENPDILLLGGDIFDDRIDDTGTAEFLAAIAGKYPCYYVTGNHEWWSGEVRFAEKMAILAEHGIPVLAGEWETLTVRGEQINICGVDDPDGARAGHAEAFEHQLAAAESAAENGYYTVLLSHRPEYGEAYAARDFDLVLCGHAHGGQWRIPLLLNGLYAPDQGLFPKFAGGHYTLGDTEMIVSRGLARETTVIPRIFNRPELVIIDVK
ncbi:MAG: metallophosphoesterase [Ruminococcaceae bacterium]|nr:metallophosphoesterase [Oscillospiraceae bacterium]